MESNSRSKVNRRSGVVNACQLSAAIIFSIIDIFVIIIVIIVKVADFTTSPHHHVHHTTSMLLMVYCPANMTSIPLTLDI